MLFVALRGGGANLQFDCAHGSIGDPLVLDEFGRFAWDGTWVRERGGPVRGDEPPDQHPATYSGRVDGERMSLTVRLDDDGSEVSSFQLGHGQPASLYRCL